MVDGRVAITVPVDWGHVATSQASRASLFAQLAHKQLSSWMKPGTMHIPEKGLILASYTNWGAAPLDVSWSRRSLFVCATILDLWCMLVVTKSLRFLHNVIWSIRFEMSTSIPAGTASATRRDISELRDGVMVIRGE